MYDSTKNEDGTYSTLAFIKRGIGLCSPATLRKSISKFKLRGGTLPCSLIVFIDYYICLLKYGAIIPDYFEYQFWRMSAYERKKYITMAGNKKIKMAFNHEPKGIF